MDDHRKLGRELGLFDTDPLIGAGLPFWLPAGAAVRHALEEYLRELERGPATSTSTRRCWASASCTRYRGTGRTTATACTRRWRWGGEQVVLRPSLCPHTRCSTGPAGGVTASCRSGWPSWAASTGPSCPGCSAG